MQGLIKLTLCVVLFISQICFCSASDRGTFFWATDMHVDIWGDSGNPEDMICAWTPSSQLLSAVAAMKEQNADPDFILVSGDIVHFPPRNSSDLSKQNILDTISSFTAWMVAEFPSTKLVPALGNHDHHPSNNWPVDVDDSAWLYNHLADIWSVWLEPDALETLGRTGWFSTDVAEGLRVITLNTNFFTVYNTYLPWNTTIADEQFTWFEGELERALSDNVKVYINGHHPAVGVHIEGGVEVGGLWPLYQQKFTMLYQTYADNIVASFWGHDHVDEARVVRGCSYTGPNPDVDSSGVNSCGGDAVGIAFVGQALTNCQVPAFREWSFDKSSFELVDYDQFWFQEDEEGVMTWPLQYRWSEAYTEMDDMKPESWRGEIERMQTNATAFDAFIERRGLIECESGSKCQQFTLCNYLFGSGHAEFLSCLWDSF
ncbi:hypothetical protein TrLO_g4037 [Triparma laevis f. longispina]|uniref:Calcineurin-like phosphoesterase domain-containing protein n=1 Tax=Triparma laevis f. longispina TaxID=1714387 RepID=A0A9W7EEU2_9STRA|nr:hypothetical protein TrLO_g4037 [Triparma laevis f. longispina]